MYAIEFQTKIRNGIIEIPEDYRVRLHQKASDDLVRVILLTSERNFVEKDDLETDYIGQLLANPLRIPGFKPMQRDEAHER